MIKHCLAFLCLLSVYMNLDAATGAADRPPTSDEVKKLVTEAYEIFDKNEQAGFLKI